MRMVLCAALAMSTLVALPVSGQETGAGTRAGTVSNNLGGGSTIAYVSPEKAFADWSRNPAMDRSRILLRIADLIERDLEKFARAESPGVPKSVLI